MLARSIARCEDDYHKRRARALDDYSEQIKRSVEDYLDSLNQNYPFTEHCYEKLRRVVLQQLQRVIAAQDFRHLAFVQIRNGRIDWLAEPFFEGQQLSLSFLIQEYDRYRHDQTYKPQLSCRQIFYVHDYNEALHDEEASESHKRKREDVKVKSEWD